MYKTLRMGAGPSPDILFPRGAFLSFSFISYHGKEPPQGVFRAMRGFFNDISYFGKPEPAVLFQRLIRKSLIASAIIST